jgi:hypothetical protein
MKCHLGKLIPLLAAAALLLSGCGDKTGTVPNDSEGGSPSTAPVPTARSAESAAPESPAAADEALDCNWTLTVDQTIPVTRDGLTVNYTLLLVAQKAGGTDVSGVYTGAAYVGIHFDASQMSVDVMQAFGGFDMNACAYDLSFEVTGYDEESFSAYGLSADDVPLWQLVEYESMALLSPEMSGSGTLDPSIVGAQGEQGGINASASGTTAIPMKITVESGKVTVSVPSFNLGDSFHGILTGVPAGAGGGDDTVPQAVEQIKSLMEQAGQ